MSDTETDESRLKEMLEIDDINPELVSDMLDVLSLGGAYANVRCVVGGRPDQRMENLAEKGFVRFNETKSTDTHNVYRITEEGYELMNLAELYLEGSG